jgi:hypothetical protein
MRALVIRACVWCGAGFEGGGANRKYCDERCRWAQYDFFRGRTRRHGQRPRTCSLEKGRPCRACGKETRMRRSQNYCSRQCGYSACRKAIDVAGYVASPERSLDRRKGYVLIYCPIHPKANGRGYVLEHRLLMELHLGRRLQRTEHVHHKNGTRWDNRLVNLEVMSPSEHAKLGGQRPHDKAGELPPLPPGIEWALLTKWAEPKPSTFRVKRPTRRLVRRCWPADDALANELWLTAATHVAARIGVTSTALKKHCKARGIPTRPRGYWAKLKASR